MGPGRVPFSQKSYGGPGVLRLTAARWPAPANAGQRFRRARHVVDGALIGILARCDELRDRPSTALEGGLGRCEERPGASTLLPAAPRPSHRNRVDAGGREEVCDSDTEAAGEPRETMNRQILAPTFQASEIPRCDPQVFRVLLATPALSGSEFHDAKADFHE